MCGQPAGPQNTLMPGAKACVNRRCLEWEDVRRKLGLPEGTELLGAGAEIALYEPGKPLMLTLALAWPLTEEMIAKEISLDAVR